MECCICGQEMSPMTKERYVIDWVNLTIEGKAHTACLGKQDKRYYPEEEPTIGQIAFAAKLKAFNEKIQEKYKGQKWPKLEFLKTILAFEALFRVSTREEWVHLNRVKILTYWWYKGPMKLPQKDYDALFEWMASFNTHGKRSELKK